MTPQAKQTARQKALHKLADKAIALREEAHKLGLDAAVFQLNKAAEAFHHAALESSDVPPIFKQP